MVDMPRRQLRDLYQVYVPVDFDDPVTGQQIRVWLFKLTGPQMQSVERRGEAARAKVLLQRDDPNSEMYLSYMAELLAIDDPEILVPLIITEQAQQARESVRARIASEPPWQTDDEDILDGLLAAWAGDPGTGEPGLAAVWSAYANEPTEDDCDAENDPGLIDRWREADKVYAKLDEFQQACVAAMDERLEELRSAEMPVKQADGTYDPDDIQTLRDRACRQFVSEEAAIAKVVEMIRQRAFYAVRQRDSDNDVPGPESRKGYFATLDDYDGCTDELKDIIQTNYDAMMVGALEGKGLRVTLTSSPASASPDPQETVEASGHEAATA